MCSQDHPPALDRLCQGEDPCLDWDQSNHGKKDNIRMEESAQIGSYMRTLLQSYERMRGRNPHEAGIPFWDLVVISAGDHSQEEWYREQLNLKQTVGELPLVNYLCVADPPGSRIGSGGSTLHILKKLDSIYPSRLYEWRVLIIHAGGYSKRLPSHSCTGKIFSPLPISTGEGLPYQMLDLKLAMYLPFLTAMEPGVFITASDDIEVFSLSSQVCPGGKGETITALAHPSSLYIGTNHGVYVMEELGESKDPQKEEWVKQEVRTCLEVLQKPRVDLMRRRGAILDREGSETVYSDSAFWFHTPTTRKMIDLYSATFPLESELCLYTHILTCLGKREEKDYVTKLLSETGKGVAVKRAVHSAVGHTRMDILALYQSKYYHLGTIEEYLHGITSNKHLRIELNFQNVVCSKIEDVSKIQGIVLQSILRKEVIVPQDSIVEYSIIDSKVVLGPKTILSSTHVSDELDIPSGFLYHTVPVTIRDNQREYVTVAFHHTDDMKYTADKSENLQYGGKLLEVLYEAQPDIYRPETVFLSSPASLWNAKLFTSHPCMAESFKETVRMVSLLDTNTGGPSPEQSGGSALYSMDDLVTIKDGEGVLEFRKKLINLYKN